MRRKTGREMQEVCWARDKDSVSSRLFSTKSSHARACPWSFHVPHMPQECPGMPGELLHHHSASAPQPGLHHPVLSITEGG